MSNAQIAAKIKQTCKKKNITISQLLEKCEIRKSLIYDLENSDYTPSVATINAIADYLNVSVDYLLGRTGDPNPTFTNVGNNNKGNQAIHGNVTVSQLQETDNRDLQLLQMIQELSPVDYARVILFIEEVKNKET